MKRSPISLYKTQPVAQAGIQTQTAPNTPKDPNINRKVLFDMCPFEFIDAEVDGFYKKLGENFFLNAYGHEISFVRLICTPTHAMNGIGHLKT